MRKKIDWEYIRAVVCAYVLAALVIAGATMLFFSSCSPRIVERVVVETEYRDRIVHDTTTVEIPKEVEKIVTRDTVSHLENHYAKSDAVVSDGFLTHSLESIPQVIKVPVEVHVTDTLYKEAQIIEKEVEVEKPLSWWESFKIGAFWWLVLAVLLLVAWVTRKLWKPLL